MTKKDRLEAKAMESPPSVRLGLRHKKPLILSSVLDFQGLVKVPHAFTGFQALCRVRRKKRFPVWYGWGGALVQCGNALSSALERWAWRQKGKKSCEPLQRNKLAGPARVPGAGGL